MYVNKKILAVSCCALFATSLNAAESSISEKFEFSGFARFVGGYLDTNEAEYLGYSDEFKLGEQSLFALQSDFTASESLSVSAQLLAHSSDARESGVEWLYLRYEPNSDWRFTLGKLRTPFNRYSGTLDVGFAYPWITPPQQVYSTFLFSNFDGATAAYRFNAASVNFEVEAFTGKYSGKSEEAGREGDDVQIQINDIKGMILSGDIGNINFRASYVYSDDIDADVPGIAQFANGLEMAGFTESAESLRFNDSNAAYQASINYDTLNYFLAFEVTKIDSNLVLVPKADSAYISAGYNFYPFQVHATLATSKNEVTIPSEQIPMGINPGLDQLAQNYQLILDNLNLNSLDSFSVGLRWDFKYNMALKGEITLLRGKENERSFFSNVTNNDFDRNAALYQIAIEWVF